MSEKLIEFREKYSSTRVPGHNETTDFMKAIYNGTVLAESDDTEVVEGNLYFPPSSLNKSYFSDSTTQCVVS
jgi:uncharacterized protein (DUF427 family)